MRARSVAVALLICLLAAPMALADGNPETLTDGRTGLVWVADPQYAVSSGFANGVVLSRSRALRMVARMNAGTLPNFGRTDWRLPTHRELHRFMKRHRLAGGQPDARSGKVRVWPVAGAASLPGVAEVAVLGTNSVRLHRGSKVTGNVVANDASPGPTLGGFELKLDRSSLVTGSVKADSIRLDQQSSITGDAAYNTLSSDGSIGGALSSPLGLPVFPLLPVFQTSSPRADAPDVFVGGGATTSIAAGEYDTVEVAAGGKLVLSGGVYEIRSLTLAGDCTFPCSSLEAAAAADVRVAGRLDVGIASFVGPQSSSGVTAAEIIVYVGGINGATGALGELPAAATVRRGSTFAANLYAPNGTIHVERDCTAAGAFFGRDVALDQNTTVALASYFVNHPPVAFPATAFTGGAPAITITLNGADPDSDSLTFSIVSGSGPAHGTLSDLTPVTPPTPPPDPLRPDPGPQPITQATVVYTPSGAGDLEDSFSFKVEDGFGGSGVAIVTINPPGSETEPPPDPDTVIAHDGADTTTTDTPVTLTLLASAPAGVGVTFSILPATGPTSGELGTLVQGGESPQRSATVVYTPDDGFEGVDSFQFEACGTIGLDEVCDTATASIQVSPPVVEPGELAPDQSVSTPQDSPVTFTLGSLSSSTGPSLASRTESFRAITGKAAFVDLAEIAGNVADANEDGLGDNHNALPGSAPVFISAGIDQAGGAGSNGTVRIHIEWNVTGMAPVGADGTAHVTLTTHRGTVDSRDTFFFAGPGGNSTLEDADFEACCLDELGVGMPVTGVIGSIGTFTFDVRSALNAALASGATHFTVQGRVDEEIPGPARGLEIHSSATGNEDELPRLEITTPGVTPPTLFTITSLPADGSLFDGATQITAVPYLLSGSSVSFTPNAGFAGETSFFYEAALGGMVDLGKVTIFVLDCTSNADECDDGR